MRKSLAELGYFIEKRNQTTFIYKSSRPELPDLIEKQESCGTLSDLQGRTQIRILEPDLVLRTLSHGGLFRHMTGQRFLSPARSLRELEISVHLIKSSVPTPEILALEILKKGPFCHITVISKLVPDSVDLLTYLEDHCEDSAEILQHTGGLIQKIHASGVYHADLHVKNILLDKDKKPWVIDLDKAYRFSTQGFLLKQKTLRRFIHSCRKWQKKGRIILPKGWEEALRDGYAEEGARR
jgi:hypothetical protein